MNLYRKFRGKRILKNALYFTIYYSGILHLLILILTKYRKCHYAAILFYHRFSKGSPDIYQLPHLNIREFEKQMQHIKRWYKVITMDNVAETLQNKNGFSVPSVVITIDDGYLNNYTLAYPVLKNLGIPAMIYITTGLIGTRKGLWVDDLMDMISLSKLKNLCFQDLFDDEILDISNRHKKRYAVSKLFKSMLQLEHQKKNQALKKLSGILGINEGISNTAERKMMNWEEVIEMSKNNIYFGAHTVSHPTLSKMDILTAKHEIYESKMDIEKKLGKKVAHFAIPNGKKEDFTDELQEYCKTIGFDTIVSTEPGLVDVSSKPFFLSRIIPPPPIHFFACELARYMFLTKN